MKIGIDVQTTLGQKTGFGFYVKNLVENLKKIDKENRYFLLKPQSEKDLSTPQRFVWDQFKMPRLALKSGVDILHQPCFSAPIIHFKMKIVVTIHDLIAIRFGKDIPFFSRQFFGKWMPFSYHWADRIICDSEHTKKDVIKILKIPEEKIKVIYLAAGKKFNNKIDKNEVQRVKMKYKIGNKYLLHTGTLSPRKNLAFLIRVFSRIVRDQPEYKLVIAGKKGWYYEGLFNLVQSLQLKEKIVFAGYVPDEDSQALHGGATLFLFPSLYEGFGLPPLEAMSCGTPIISSNTSSLPEIVGEGGILLSPHDELGWSREIKRLLSDSRLRTKLKEKGLKQAQKFSWKKCAQETIKIYEGFNNDK